MKIAHFSDLHFSHFVTNPIQFFTKTWIGNANLLLKRGQRLKAPCKDFLIESLKQINPDVLLLSGDFTTTSQTKEFIKAKAYVDHLKDAGFKVLTIPGNHDHYTKKAFSKKIFYNFLAHHQKPSFGDLKSSGYEIHLYDTCAIILLDLTHATPWFTAYGTFNHKLQELLLSYKSELDDRTVIVSGHFPLLKPNGEFHHALRKGEHLLDTLQKIKARYYLHGHNHNFCIIKEKEVIQVDSGSISDIYKGSFSVLDTEQNTITPFFRRDGQFIQGQTYAG